MQYSKGKNVWFTNVRFFSGSMNFKINSDQNLDAIQIHDCKKRQNNGIGNYHKDSLNLYINQSVLGRIAS